MNVTETTSTGADSSPKQHALSTIEVALANRQDRVEICQERLCQAAREVLDGEGILRAEISLAIVDDEEIHAINRQFLAHDEPTDVISFLLEHDDKRLLGEIVASADTAVRCAPRFGWTADDELLLYVIHGALHLAGYDDLSEAARPQMRARERHYLARFGLSARDEMPPSGRQEENLS